jgi:hypothetical protein
MPANLARQEIAQAASEMIFPPCSPEREADLHLFTNHASFYQRAPNVSSCTKAFPASDQFEQYYELNIALSGPIRFFTTL